MKRNSLKFLLLGVILMLFATKRASAAQVVFTGLAGSAPAYLTQGATNQVLYGFSVFVPSGGTFNPGPVHIAGTSSANGFLTGNLIRTTAATPSLAISAPQASYGATFNGTVDINGFPTLTGGGGGTTYYFYLVVSVTVTVNPPPTNVIFSLPASGSISQNGYGGGITVNNLASTTYNFGVNPPTSPGGSNCGPGTVSLTASDASPAGGTYNWYAASTGGLPVSTGATYSPSISTTTTYYVSYTYGLNTSTRTAVTATINPVASATFTSTASITAGNSPTVTYTGTDPGTSTYAWSFTGATPATRSGQSPAAVTYSTPGTYTISLTVTNSAGCSATTNNSITVNPAPPTASPVTQCGAGATLTASASPAGGTYNWYTAATGGTSIQTGATLSNIQSTATYYVSYTYGGLTSTRTAVTATINPTVASPLTGTSFSYPFDAGSLTDITQHGNTATSKYTNASSTGPSSTTDRFGVANTAYSFDGLGQYLGTTTAYPDPETFTISLWFNTTTTQGGKLIGFDNLQSPANGSAPSAGQFDRHIYMTNSGQLYFGVYNSGTHTIFSPLSYNDGNWHHVVVTFGPTRGEVMYIDGAAVANNASFTAAEPYTGYWRIGGDNISGWPSAPTSNFFAGKIDDVSVYSTEQTAAVANASNNLNLIGFPATAQCLNNPISFTAQTISGATYTWQDSGGNTQTGQNVTFPTGTAGNYTLTVTGGPGGCSSTATVTPPFLAAPSATFTIPATIIMNGSVTATYTGTDPATSTFHWTFPGGSIASYVGQVPPAVTYTVPGSYNIGLSVTNTSGCYTTVVNTFNVIPAAPTATSVTQCGAGASLTATGTPSGGTYNWYTAATGGTAIQSGSSAAAATLSNIQSTGTYYVSYAIAGVESARTAVTATINPIVSAPYSGAYLSYPFNGNTNDVSGDGNTGVNNGATLTTDRYGSANAAYSFNGTSAYMSNSILDNNPSTYTVSIWFNTTTTTGGSIIGLANGSSYDDRVLYMANSGQLYWGLYPGSIQTINTNRSFNDGLWHHVIVTVGTDGSTMYVDGVSLGSNSAMTTGNGVVGFWQIGYSLINGIWTNSPTNNYFTGSLDDIAIYHRELTSAEISSSNDLNQIFVGTASACGALSFTAPTITGATYTWKDPNNATLTGQTVSFPGAVAGNYTLTVTGGPGGCSSSATLTPVISAAVTSAFFVPASIPVSTNTTVTLYSAVGGSTYSWNFGSGASPATGTGTGPFTVQWSTTGVKTITLTVTASGGCVTTTTNTITVTSTAYGNYTYSRTITLNNKAVGMSGNLTNFPVLLSIQSNDLIVSGTCNDKIQNPNGPNYDFAFFDPSAQSELYYQIENYNSTTGTLLVWVRVPTLYAATNNTLSFYYGSKAPLVNHNATFQSLTWNTDYQAVYHFNETAYQTTTADGTLNGRTATLAGFQSTDYVAAGKIGSCYTFGGTSGSPTANDMEASPAPVSTQYTLSAWINTTNNASDEKILTNQNSSGMASGGYKMGVYYGIPEDEGNNQLNRSSTPNPATLANGTWYHVVGVYDGSHMSTYVNGVQYKVVTATGSIPLTNTLFIGIGEGKQYPFSGMIDEPRVSNVAKSGDWIKMEYTNQNNPSAFTTLSTNATTCSTANGGSIPGEISYTWTGATSTDPSVASNWNNTATATSALPPFDGTESLIIPTGLSRYPALTASVSAYGLTIASGATLNLNGFILSVGCHIYNGSGGQILYGTTSTAGGITFNGSLTTQYYYGTTTGIANVANLTVNNSAGGTLDITGGAFGVNNILTLTNGNLLVDNAGSGSLTLLSSATNSGSVAAIPTGSSITGNVNVQRYITNGTGTRGYRLLSSPVNVNSSTSGANTNLGLTYLNTDATFNSTTYHGAYTQGPGTGFNLNGSVHPIIYLYDETQATYNRSFTGGKNIGVYSITGAAGSPAYGVITQGATVASSAINLPTGTSYLLYFVGSDQSTSVATSRVPDATTLTATGYLNQGTIPFKFWKTGSTSLPYDITSGTTNYGIFQAGNPYASTINLNTLYTDNYVAGTNAIGAAFYELIPAGNYVSYNASNGYVSDVRASRYIVSGQGFLAQTTAPGQTLTFKEDQKVSYNTAATLLESIRTATPTMANAHIVNDLPSSAGKGHNDAIPVNTAINAGLHVQLSMDSANYAQTGVYFKNTASDKYASSEDAVEIDGGTPQVFLSSYSADNVKLSINTVADYGLGKRIPLYANANYSGTYTLSLADISGVDTSDYTVYVVDKKQADSLDLVHNKAYSFTINTGDTTTYGANRFVLAVQHKPVKDYKLATFTGAKVSTGVQLKWTAVNAGNYTGYTLQKLNSTGGYDSLYSVQSDTGTTAYSFVDMHPIIGNNTYRLAQNGITGATTYSAAVTIGYSSTTPNGNLTVYPNPAKTIINVNIPASSVNTPNYVADIYNAQGQVVNHQTVTNSTWTSDVSSYKLGLYVLQVKDTNGNVVGLAKFVKVE